MCMVLDRPVARQEGVAGDGYHLYRQRTVSVRLFEVSGITRNRYRLELVSDILR
jgi:hypothetical protein